MKKIGIIGSRDLACKILDWIVDESNVEIIGVVAPPFKGWWNDNLRQTALDYNLTVFDDLFGLLKKGPDIIFSVNYWKLIDEETIQKVPDGIVNIHHSYLLKYRGRYSTSWAIINARKLNYWQHGTTLHYITKELDSGPIIASYKCEILETDTAETLFIKVEELAVKMFKDHFYIIINNQCHYMLKPDPEYMYYDKNSNMNLEIECEWSILETYDFVRAWTYRNRPRPFLLINNRKIMLTFHE